jgi:hypothetical protein
LEAEAVTEPALEYVEVLRQEYSENACVFSAGHVHGHPIDTLYLRLEKRDVEPLTILLRPDEAACLAWLLNGVLWSKLIEPELVRKP